jgi:Pectinacetylesterase
VRPARFLLGFALLFIAIAVASACGSGGGGGSAPASDSGTDGHAVADAQGDGPAVGEAGGNDAPSDGPAVGEAGGDGPVATDGSFPLGMPITAPANQWTFVPFSDAFCGNGTSTGIGINPSSTGSRVLIYLEGGGACWSDLTCYSLMTASYFTTGYGASDFATESTSASYLAQPGGFFDRSAAANPFKDYSYVYVPYCTGDIHAGNNIATYGTNMGHHVGFANFTHYLSRVVPTFPSADRVILAGSSAGGYGALFNWSQTQQAFGSVRVDLIDDCGPFLTRDVEMMSSQGDVEATWRTQWNLPATFPAGCTGCATSMSAFYGFYASAFPNSRASILDFTQDSTLPSFWGITTAQFTAGLGELIAADVTPAQSFRAFQVAQMNHVLWFDPTLVAGADAGGVSVQQFLTAMVTDSSSWQSEGP